MAKNEKETQIKTMVRGAYIVPEETDDALRALAEAGNRPLSREIRQALEEYVARNYKAVA